MPSQPLWRRPLFWIACFSVLAATGVFFGFWRYGYSSDTAVIGLMAKSILARGEHPIFVWKVGYQGILLETHAIALCFKLFGINPYSLNLWNTVCLWADFALFFYVIRAETDATIALLATTLLPILSPDFYAMAMRTQPNYTEIFFMGLALVALSQWLIRHFCLERGGSTRKSRQVAVAAGFLAGFGAYTYGQISFFYAAIGAQLIVLYLRFTLSAPDGPWAWLRRHLWLRIIAWGNLVHLLLAILFFLLDRQRMDWPGGHVSFSPIGMMEVSFLIFALYAVGDLYLRLGDKLRGLWREALLGGAALVIGFSPTLIFRLQHGKVQPRTGMGGTLKDILQRLEFARVGLSHFVNTAADSAVAPTVRWFWMMGACLVFIWFLARTFRAIVGYVRGRTDEAAILQISPIRLLPWVVFPIFSIATAVTDFSSARYTLVVLFAAALALSLAIVEGWRRSAAWRGVAFVGVALLVVNDVASIRRAVLRSEQQGFTGERAIPVLDELGIRYGYAQYWDAYSVDLYTNERIILEPTYSNYNPYYAALVAEQKRTVYVDADPPSQAPIDGRMKIYDNTYQVTETRHVDGLVIYVLEKLGA